MTLLPLTNFSEYPASGIGKDDRIDALGSQFADAGREQAARLAILNAQRTQAERRFATQVTLATLGLPANWDREWYPGYFIPTQTPAPERNELAEREDADKRRKFPWRFGDRGGET